MWRIKLLNIVISRCYSLKILSCHKTIVFGIRYWDGKLLLVLKIIDDGSKRQYGIGQFLDLYQWIFVVGIC